MRYAIYWYPNEDDPLLAAGEAWLGRRAGGGISDPQPPVEGLAAERFSDLTRAARRYGLHATIAPPMALIDAVTPAAFLDAVNELARGLAPVAMPRLEIAKLSRFIALRPVESDASLRAIAARAVSAVDAFRRAPTPEELARRRAQTLSERERALLERWGYPYVFDAYRFHVTLSDPVAGPESDALVAAARRHFAAALARPRMIDGLALFAEAHPDAPFRLLARVPFGLAAET